MTNTNTLNAIFENAARVTREAEVCRAQVHRHTGEAAIINGAEVYVDYRSVAQEMLQDGEHLIAAARTIMQTQMPTVRNYEQRAEQSRQRTVAGGRR